MRSIVETRGVRFGAGLPKICVPATGATEAALLEEAALLDDSPADLLEWRADYFEGLCDAVSLASMLERLRRAVGGRPILFTVRTGGQGGNADLEAGGYAELLRLAVDSGCVDMVDIELTVGDALCRELTDHARGKGVVSVVSMHDFRATPPGREMVETLEQMRALGADLPKIAVMPQSDGDVRELLAATEIYCRDGRPAVAISMGERGGVSRVAGELYGSVMTFGVLRAASAPGQLDAARLRAAMEALHGAGGLPGHDIDAIRGLLALPGCDA